MTDPRFANPPEELELPEKTASKKSSSKKGKGRLMNNDDSIIKAASSKKKQSLPTAEDSESEGDLYDEVLNGPLPSTSQAVHRDGAENDDDKDDDEDKDDNDEDGPLNLLPKVLQIDNVNEFNEKVDMTGLIYLSRIPPGMGPSKVKHILSNYGEIGRIYLVAADDAKSKHKSSNSNKPGKEHKHHQAHRFVEGWVEFMDKRVARSTAELLNAKTIGDVALSKTSKKNGGTKKWKDDVWTMKYLPRFKWNMLSEQVAIEAATRAALLRNELAQSKKEQAEYLRQVDRAKNYEKAQDKKRARQERKGGTQTNTEDAGEATEGRATKKAKKERDFEQRTVVSQNTGNGTVDAKLGSVLDSLF